MRGDQLARERGIFRAIEASPKGLTVRDIAQWTEIGFRAIYQDLEALKASGFSQYTEKIKKTNHWAFRKASKFGPFPPFTLIEPRLLYSYRDLIPSSIHGSVHGLEVGPASPSRGSE